jgi:predicted amidohydrolase YtcJ
MRISNTDAHLHAIRTGAAYPKHLRHGPHVKTCMKDNKKSRKRMTREKDYKRKRTGTKGTNTNLTQFKTTPPFPNVLCAHESHF